MVNLKDPKTADRLYRALLLIMAGFFLFEFLLHFSGLPALQHDKIFLPTHDRYIALYGLVFAGLLTMLATTHRHDKTLYKFTSVMLFLGAANAVYISVTQQYDKYFDVSDLDGQLGWLALAVLIWYILLKITDHYSHVDTMLPVPKRPLKKR